MTISISQPYTTTMVALFTRGCGICLFGLCRNDSGEAYVTTYLKNTGAHPSDFKYVIVNIASIKVYWKTTAYSNRVTYSILSNNRQTSVSNIKMETPPSNAISF